MNAHYQTLINKIAVAQTIEERKVHEIKNTKEIAEILKTTTKKAYLIMVEIEKNDNAFKYGYKTKHGFEDPDNSGLRANSLYWQIYS